MSAPVRPVSQLTANSHRDSLASAMELPIPVDMSFTSGGSPGSSRQSVPIGNGQSQRRPPTIVAEAGLDCTEKSDNPPPQVAFDNGGLQAYRDIQPDVVRGDLIRDDDNDGQATNERSFFKQKSVIVAIGMIVGIAAIMGILFGTLVGTGVIKHGYVLHLTLALCNNLLTLLHGSVSMSSSPTVTDVVSSTVSSVMAPTPTTLLTSTTSSFQASIPASTVGATFVLSTPSTSTVILTLSEQIPFPAPASATPAQCLQDATFVKNVSFVMGLTTAADRGYDFAQADSQVHCCMLCYLLTSTTYRSCNLWSYDGTNRDVPCVLLRGFLGSDPDNECPYGHTNASDFTIKLEGAGVAGRGPCGDPGVGTIGLD
jgi:hypothetical protein